MVTHTSGWLGLLSRSALLSLLLAAAPLVLAGRADTVGPADKGTPEPRVDAGHFVNIATARLWRFRLHGVDVGRAYSFSIVGQGAEPIIGRGSVDTLPHEHAVDLRGFRKGWIAVTVELLDPAGNAVESVTDSVYRDAAYPAGYL